MPARCCGSGGQERLQSGLGSGLEFAIAMFARPQCSRSLPNRGSPFTGLWARGLGSFLPTTWQPLPLRQVIQERAREQAGGCGPQCRTPSLPSDPFRSALITAQPRLRGRGLCFHSATGSLLTDVSKGEVPCLYF